MTGGTYTLLLECSEETTIEIGAFGECRLPAGWYAYTGSALGPGGFARVDRHYDLAAGERTTRHWHVDYLLGSDAVAVRGDVRTPGADVECTVASALGDGIVDGFGASDCACTAHLAHDGDGGRLRRSVSAAHRHATPEE